MNSGATSQAESLGLLPDSQRQALIAALTETELRAFEYDWKFWARPKQLAPAGDWLTWILRAGRGFGKTRTGAGWVHERAMQEPRWCALVAKTPADARDYQIEGPGGLLRNAPPHERPNYESSKRRLTWPNGSWATVYSSEEAGQLRGFSGDTAWLDEFAKYTNPREVWDNLQFGMREVSADMPRVCITTTPRPLPLLTEMEEDESTIVVTGSSYENRANLAPEWFAKTLAKYEGTRLGLQEIHAQILDDVEGRVYDTFSKRPWPEGNVDDSVTDTGAELLVGMDFNVNPMSFVIAVRAADECHVLDAVEMPTSNTDEVAQEIRNRYPDRYVAVYPDPSGKARKTSAPVGQTDFTILESYGFEIRAPLAAPLVVDRVNNSLALFKQGTRRRVRIHPRCKPLITALNSLQYKQGTSVRDKGSGFDHICDALDYLLWQEFNVMQPSGLILTTYQA